ncbi:MAG TPA: CSLREA domain-containing protein, partial [Thioploca sp.]|nr:CSLREA domain-containing protein [Thioploca sp.]
MKIIYCYLTILMLTFNVNAKVITVNNASDNNNGNCELDCSLRDAIMTAK